jgi:hypothetical protein
LDIRNSTFTDNVSDGGGGAIWNENNTLTVSNSTFSGNTGSLGGAIFNTGTATTTIVNSTFSGNHAPGSGAVIYNNGGTLNYANTIMANAVSGGECVNAGTLGANVNNLVEDGSCSASLSGDPAMGALADNGGATETFALLVTSTAIDAGSDTICLPTSVNGLDQRGFRRLSGAHCDIGSYEYVDTIAPTVNSFTATTPSASHSIPITAFTASDEIGVTGYTITESATPPAAGGAGWSTSAPTPSTPGPRIPQAMCRQSTVHPPVST